MSSWHQKATMKRKQHQEVAVTVSRLDNKSKKTKSLSNKAPDSSGEDSELEENFALLNKKSSSGMIEEDQEESEREEEEYSLSGGEALEDASEEEANDENAESDGVDQTGLGSDTEDSEDVDDDAEQPESVNSSGEIQTEDDIKKGKS